MSVPDRGFAFMKSPSVLTSAYESSPALEKDRSYINQLRECFGNIRPARYRGIGRYPLNVDYAYCDEDDLAMLALAEILGVTGDRREEAWLVDGPWLIPDIPCANEIAELMERPGLYELVEVARLPSRTQGVSLGFDVGYWASGNFSLICDTAVWPLWHPAPVEALPVIGEALCCLNDAVLFPDVDSAASFRETYRSQSWAELEGTKFEIVEVAVVGTTT